MDFTQKFLAQCVNISDRHREMLSRLEPMKITPLRKQGMEDSTWGVPLSLRQGK